VRHFAARDGPLLSTATFGKRPSVATSLFHKIKLDFHFVNVNNVKGQLNFIEGEAMEQVTDPLPPWLTGLNDEDLQFVRRFLLSSGSLKALAQEYGVSYPTVRARLDRLIAKVRAAEDVGVRDPFERKVRLLVADAQLSATLAKELLDAHRVALERREDQ
jgi:hypothetical protein